MNAILRFLQAARSLKNSGITKEQVLEFAKREFGEVSAFLRKQIDNIFKSPATGTKSKSKGEVVPFKKKEGIESLDEILAKGVEGEDPDLAKLLRQSDDLDAPTEKENPLNLFLNIKNPRRPGGALDPVMGLTRTIARRILNAKKVSIDKADPIDVFDKTFGTDIAIDIKNLAEELLEMERMGRSTKDLDTILKQEGLLDMSIPKNPARGMTDNELQNLIKETDQEKILKDFDPTDREPNAAGGLAGIINL